MSDVAASRRSFVARAAAMMGVAALGPSVPSVARGMAIDNAAAPRDELEPWLVALNGKHKQLFHAHDKWTKGMEYAKRWLELYSKEYGVPANMVNSVLAAHGKTGMTTYSDAVWDKYDVGTRFDVKDPATGQPARRNVFLAYNEKDDAPGLMDAMKAGVVVLSCRTAMRGFAKSLADEHKFGSADEIERDLTSSLIPGVVMVPTMVIAIGKAQERGCSYLYTG